MGGSAKGDSSDLVGMIGPWPEPLANPKFERLESTNRESFVQYRFVWKLQPGK